MTNKEKMFDAYNQHLNIVRGLNITNRTDEYICPICLQGFCKDDIDQLSLEDAPQNALGGKKIALTCRKCNSTCGHTIDSHLVNSIIFYENKKFLTGSERKIRIPELDINGILKVKNNNEKELLIPKNYFKSSIHSECLKTLVAGKEIGIQDKSQIVKFHYVTAAVIKSAYIILFNKTGYTFLLDEYYNAIRKYIVAPETITRPKGMWKIIKISNCSDGVYLSNSKKCRGFCIIYTVSKIQSYKIITYIPSPLVKFEDAIISFQNLKTGNDLLLQKLDSQSLLVNADEIKSLREWTYSDK